MEILVALLFLTTIYFAYKSNQLYKDYLRKISLALEYLRTLFLVMDANKLTEDDLREAIWKSFLFDSNSLPLKEFNKKWEAVSENNFVPATKDHLGVTSKTVEGIVKAIYSNKDNFNIVTKQYPNTLSVKDLEKLGEASDKQA